MRKTIGAILILGGLVFGYLFAAYGSAAAGAGGSGPAALAPFRALAASYPKGAVCLVAALAGCGGGLLLLMRGEGGVTGSFGRGFCVLSLGSCAAWGVAWLGVRSGAPAASVGAFVVVAALAAVLGLLFAILGFFEKPKPVAALAFGWLAFATALGAGIAGWVMR